MSHRAKLSIACRFCTNLVTNSALIPIFKACKQVDRPPIFIVTKYFTPNFSIRKNDGLPQQICTNCFKKLVLLDNFLKECEKSQFKLKNYFWLPRNQEETVDVKIKPEISDAEYKVQDEEIESIDYNDNEEKQDMDFENNEGEDNEIVEYYDSDNSDLYFNDNFKEDFNFTCRYCKKNFRTDVHMEHHITRCHKISNPATVICEHCGIEFHKHTYSEHILYVRSGVLPFPCNHCDERFQSTLNLIHHVKMIHKQNPVKNNSIMCSHCSKIFSSEIYLEKHLKLCHKNEPLADSTMKKIIDPPLFICSICNRKFVKFVSLKKHQIVTHTLKREQDPRYKPQNCKYCGQIYGRSDHLQNHIKQIHLKQLDYKCKYCERSYVRQFQLNRHIKISHNKIRKVYECKQCPQTFTEKKTYVKHIAIHCDTPQFKCVVCGKEFVQFLNLRKHEELHNFEAAINLKAKEDVNEEIQTKFEETLVELVESDNSVDEDIKSEISNEE